MVCAVLWIVLVMLGIVAVAAVVVLYVAFPHRGEPVPRTPWVGEAMRKGVDLLPTLDNQRENQHDDRREHQREREHQHH